MNCPNFHAHHLAGSWGVLTPFFMRDGSPRDLKSQGAFDDWFDQNAALLQGQTPFAIIGDDLTVLRDYAARYTATACNGWPCGGRWVDQSWRTASVLGCYGDMALRSAEMMALERREWREFTGRRPLSSTEQDHAWRHDVILSASQFAVDDVAEEYGLITRPLLPGQDVQPYNFRDLIAGYARVGDRIQAKRAAYEKQLAEEVETALGGGPVTDAAAVVIEELQRAIKADPFAPADPSNVNQLATLDPARREYILAKVAGDQESHDAKVATAANTWTGNVIHWWQENGPTVEMYRDDNANLGATELFVRVRAQEKPKPKPGKWLKWGGLISFAAGFIPVVGNIVSFALSTSYKQSVKAFLANAASPGGGIFEPQYDPPTLVFNLPGDLAAGLLDEPELLPINVERLAVQGYNFTLAIHPPAPKSAPLTGAEVRAARARAGVAGSGASTAESVAVTAGLGWLAWKLFF